MIINMTGGGAAKPKIVDLAVTANPAKTAYEAGESFDKTGMTVVVYYDDGISEEITDYRISPSTLSLGDKNVTISHTVGEITATTVVPVTVRQYLYNAGNEYIDFTGGINEDNYHGSKGADSIWCRLTSAGTTHIWTTNKIDITNAVTLYVEVANDNNDGSGTYSIGNASRGTSCRKCGKSGTTMGTTGATCANCSSFVYYFDSESSATVTGGNRSIITHDLSAVSGVYYVLIENSTVGLGWNLFKIWLE